MNLSALKLKKVFYFAFAKFGGALRGFLWSAALFLSDFFDKDAFF